VRPFSRERTLTKAQRNAQLQHARAQPHPPEGVAQLLAALLRHDFQCLAQQHRLSKVTRGLSVPVTVKPAWALPAGKASERKAASDVAHTAAALSGRQGTQMHTVYMRGGSSCWYSFNTSPGRNLRMSSSSRSHRLRSCRRAATLPGKWRSGRLQWQRSARSPMSGKGAHPAAGSTESLHQQVDLSVQSAF